LGAQHSRIGGLGMCLAGADLQGNSMFTRLIPWLARTYAEKLLNVGVVFYLVAHGVCVPREGQADLMAGLWRAAWDRLVTNVTRSIRLARQIAADVELND
jgi:hypothetical protein